VNQDAPENEEIKGLSAWRDKLIRLDDLISKQDVTGGRGIKMEREIQ
jgi:hypothetical protein